MVRGTDFLVGCPLPGVWGPTLVDLWAPGKEAMGLVFLKIKVCSPSVGKLESFDVEDLCCGGLIGRSRNTRMHDLPYATTVSANCVCVRAVPVSMGYVRSMWLLVFLKNSRLHLYCDDGSHSSISNSSKICFGFGS